MSSPTIPPPTGDASDASGGADASPAEHDAAPRHNLPAQPSALVDRERELALACRLLRAEGGRLVTLLGPGGVGKTRLAIAVAEALLPGFPDGAWLVDLASVGEPGLVVRAIAGALVVGEAGGPGAIESLRRHLRNRRLLLVLDNCEHLLAAMPEVGELLGDCRGLTILATSREPLRLRWERRLPVPPLALADPRGDRSPDMLLASPAVALFVERARAVRPDFALDETNGQTVAELCARLDGLPLAIELAAAQSDALPPAALLTRLKRHLPLPGAGPADGPSRHRTLAAAIGWSYDLLDAPARELFRRMGVFAGGWSPAAAEAVIGQPGLDALDGLLALVDKGLVRPAGQAIGRPRFGMLETIRQFALERMDEADELAEVRRRHAQHYLALAERAAPEGRGPPRSAWFDRLEREHDNLRAALRWAAEQGDAETELRLGAALWRFWDARGHVREGIDWLEDALARPLHGSDGPRAAALEGAGTLARALAATPDRAAWPTGPASGGDPANPLSDRERAVLRLVAEGLVSKQIGRKLGLGERTVKAHVTGAMNKLGANTRSQVVALAVERDLL
ncbi:MAG TPA: LuxR C-terminal-related transcriptional regulator [Chloroflexota bacterium]